MVYKMLKKTYPRHLGNLFRWKFRNRMKIGSLERQIRFVKENVNKKNRFMYLHKIYKNIALNTFNPYCIKLKIHIMQML